MQRDPLSTGINSPLQPLINLYFGEPKPQLIDSTINTPTSFRTLKNPSTPLPEGVVVKKMSPILKHRPQHNLISNDTYVY
jgi:hypothetical protein